MGLAYLKNFLIKNKFRSEIIDGYLLQLSCDQLISKIVKDLDAKILGFSPFLDSLKAAIYISQKVKQKRPDIFICWGGHLATFSAEDFLKNKSIDCIVRGEGEITFLELVRRINLKKSFKNIKGIAFRENYKVIFSKPRGLIPNLDMLPFPDRENTKIAVKQGSLAQISGSRGCYGNCSFCSINSFYRVSKGNKWRGRSPKNIVDELEYLNKQGFSMFKFVDDSFFGPGKNWEKRGIEIADEIIKRKLIIRFRISARVNNVDRRVFKKLKKSGLYAVSLGVESGSQRALNLFNKGTTVAQNKKSLKILEELGIITLMGFIGFDPYMSLSDIEKNLSFLKQTMFCMSDLVSKSLYIHAEDDITKKLIRENKIRGRDFPNYIYEIDDKKVANILQYLKTWNLFNKRLFYKISDPLMAPRITKKADEASLLKLHLKMRKIDLKIYDSVFEMVKQGRDQDYIKDYLKQSQKKVLPIWNQIENKFNKLTNQYERAKK